MPVLEIAQIQTQYNNRSVTVPKLAAFVENPVFLLDRANDSASQLTGRSAWPERGSPVSHTFT